MIILKQITLHEIHLPLKEPFTISSGTQDMRRILLLEVEDHDGTIGWGECVASEFPNYSPETIDTSWLAIQEWVGPRVIGKTFAGPGEIFPFLQKDIRGHLMAKAAVEMAAWELTARKRNISLAKLLHGTRTTIETGISLGIQKSPEALAAKVKEAVDEGYRKIKVKIKPGADLEYIRHVRKTLGPDIPLMVDANNAYMLDELGVLKTLDEFDLIMIEQPLAWDDLRRHAELQKNIKTPICLDESITGIERVEDMIALKSGRIVNIKPGRVGGFASAIAIHDLCMKHDIPVWCGGMLESGVGRAHNVALASLPNFTIPGDISPSKRYWEKDIVIPEWEMMDGRMTVPVDKPGMGVEVDRGRVEELTVRKTEVKV
jgi:o-succinylbenzoate synthase